jgi:hypothetical protein
MYNYKNIDELLKFASIKQQLIEMNAEIDGDYVTLYRGGNASEEELKSLKYNDFLSTVAYGDDVLGNAGASSYGNTIITVKLPIKDLKYTNGEIQYQGHSNSLKGKKYPIQIYKAYNNYYGSNYTGEEIDALEFNHIREVASMALLGGKEEFDQLTK